MAYHRFENRIGVFRGHPNRQISASEDPTLGFGAGHIVALKQFDKNPRLLNLEVIFLRGEFVEPLREPAPAAPLDHEVDRCACKKLTLRDKYVNASLSINCQ